MKNLQKKKFLYSNTITQHNLNQVPSAGRTGVLDCLYDVNRGRLTYLRGFKGGVKLAKKERFYTVILYNLQRNWKILDVEDNNVIIPKFVTPIDRGKVCPA
ncbi:MAG: hypothetical protein DCC43_15290 [Candidatus Brocadia sp.]|nr:hypothetical protein [Candidatus Brocadia sp. AMX3]RIJ89588.1 MAG: hypothetical protein DCC43_15290 [Candidatus Brocadia sp.]